MKVKIAKTTWFCSGAKVAVCQPADRHKQLDSIFEVVQLLKVGVFALILLTEKKILYLDLETRKWNFINDIV